MSTEETMDPQTFRYRVFDAFAGRRFFRNWLEESLDAMRRVAAGRAQQGDRGRSA